MQTNSEKVALVVGGTDGIGKEIALGLAKENYSLIIVGRNSGKGSQAVAEIIEKTKNENVTFFKADISLIAEVNNLADMVSMLYPSLHLLVLNAGIVNGRRELTREGIELNFAVNYLSRYALALKLISLLQKGSSSTNMSRILLVSGAAKNGTIYYDDVNLTNNYNIIRVILQQCQANDLFTLELAEQLKAANLAVTVNNYKIGVVKTNIRKTFPPLMKWLVSILFDPLLVQTPQQAAEPALKLLLDKEYENKSGLLFKKVTKFKQVIPSEKTKNKQERLQLWKLSSAMINKIETSVKIKII